MTEDDRHALGKNGLYISDGIVNASQLLMKQQFNVDGFQNTLLGQSLKFKHVETTDTCMVQVLHTGTSRKHLLTIHKLL